MPKENLSGLLDSVIKNTCEYARPSGRAKDKHCLGAASNLSQTDHQNPFLKGGVKQDKRTTAFLFVFLLIVCLSRLLLFYLAPLPLAPDETHYWEWSKRLDLGYYSKGPLVAWLIAASTAVFGDTQLGVRMPALTCTLLFSLLFFHFTRKLSSAATSLFCLVLLQTTLLFSYLSIGMTTDPPAALAWLSAAYFAHQAIKRNSAVDWPLCMLSIGIGAWAKYSLFMLAPLIASYCVINSRLHVQFKRSSFWAGMLLLALTALPLILWNKSHGWVNVMHNAGHLSSSKEVVFQLRYLGELVGGQLGLIGPLLLGLLLYALMVGVKFYLKEKDLDIGLLVWLSAPFLLLCIFVALHKRVYANWPMPGYISLFVLAAVLRERGLLPVSSRMLRHALTLNCLLLLLGHLLFAGYTFGLPGRYLPTKKLVGWNALGDKIKLSLKTHPLRPSFVITERYDAASAIAFYAQIPAEVYVANLGRRMNQYDIWGGWKDRKGEAALLILKSSTVPKSLQDRFARITPIDPPQYFSYDLNGDPMRTYSAFVGEAFDGRSPELPEVF